MPTVALFVDLQAKALVRGFGNSIEATFPPSYQGDTLQLALRFMNQTGNPSAPYVDADQSTAYVQAAMGTVAGVPTSGTFTISDPDGVQTTAAIAWNATAATLQSAIQAGLTTYWSLATVTGNAGGPWVVTNGANAARTALVVDGGSLVPASQGNVIVQAAGDGSNPAIQYLRLQLSPVAYQDTWTAFPAPTITVANVQTGGVAGSNSIQSITLNNQPYNGTFTISFGGQTTAPIQFNASPGTVQSALQALSSIGTGNCTVGGSIGAYQVTFIGSKGGAAQSPFTANADALIGPVALVGDFSLATVGIEEAVGASSSISQTFEINITPAGGAPQTVLQVPCSILNDLIPNAPANPVPTTIYLTEGVGDGRYAQQSNNGSDFANLSQTFKNLWVAVGTTLGDLVYSAASGVATRLAGNTTATKKFLVQTGTGSASTAPGWGTIAAGDVPTLNQNTTGSAGSVAVGNITGAGTGVLTALAVAANATGGVVVQARLTGTLVAGAATITNGAITTGSLIQPFHNATVTTHNGALFVSALSTGSVTITSTNALDVDTITITVQ